MAGKWIYWLEELGREHNDLVGKKCANLGEMTRLGMRVPPGFAVSVEGYRRFMDRTGLGERLARYFGEHGQALAEDVGLQLRVSREVRAMIRQTPVPEDMAGQIASHYRELCTRCAQPEVAVAVRSSGAVSMPGQMDTYLNVRGEAEVVRKVREVWESTFNARAIAFRLERGLRVDEAPIGVAVLKMVNAKSAGVALTVVPTVGDLDKVVIEGNWGLGESVVSGEINPDRFVVDKKTSRVEKHLNRKTKQVVFMPEGTALAEVPPELQDRPCLEDREILEIARIAQHVERHFGVPQDMEWVVDRDLPFPENIVWVQTRPARYTRRDARADTEYLLDRMTQLFRL